MLKAGLNGKHTQRCLTSASTALLFNVGQYRQMWGMEKGEEQRKQRDNKEDAFHYNAATGGLD